MFFEVVHAVVYISQCECACMCVCACMRACFLEAVRAVV